jgi:hypothetical protein
MSTVRYRIGIDQSKIVDWRAGRGRGATPWYCDYGAEAEAVQALAKQIERDLKKWRVCEAKHGSGLSPAERLVSAEKRSEIIQAALLRIANATDVLGR